MRTTLAALIVVILAGPLARADDKPLEGDAKKLQGKWKTNAGPASSPLFFNFEKNTLTITLVTPQGDEKTISGEYTVEEMKGTPCHMDWSKMKVGKTDLPNVLAIYEFDGDDKLKVAGGPNDKTRPTGFTEKPADGSQGKGNVLTFTRVKDEKK